MWRRHRTAVTLLIAAGQPVLLVGTATAAAHLGAYGPDGGAVSALRTLLWIATGLLWLATIALDVHPLALFLAGVAAMIALSTATGAVSAAALHERGVTSTCTVLGVESRTETSSTYVSDGTGGGHWQTTTTTVHDHSLRCPGTGLDPVVLTSGAPQAERGERLTVLLDPAGRIAPRPASAASDGSGQRLACLIALAAAIVLRVGAVLVEHRPPWRSRRLR